MQVGANPKIVKRAMFPDINYLAKRKSYTASSIKIAVNRLCGSKGKNSVYLIDEKIYIAKFGSEFCTFLEILYWRNHVGTYYTKSKTFNIDQLKADLNEAFGFNLFGE